MDKKRKSRRGSGRMLVQAAFFALTNGYAQGFVSAKLYKGGLKRVCVPGLSCYSCPGALGACPIGALQAVQDSGKFRFSAYVLGLLLLFGVLLGRLVCGWLCPFGLFQDLLHRIPLGRKRKTLPGHAGLRWLKYGILLLFVLVLPMAVTGASGVGKPWFCAYVCPSGTLLGGLPLLLADGVLRQSVGWLFAWKLGLLALIAALAVKFDRPFCKYLCPLGAIYGCFNPISLSRMRVDKTACTRCGACQTACGADLRVWEQPNSTECIRCGACKAACPHGAITSTMDDLLAAHRRRK